APSWVTLPPFARSADSATGSMSRGPNPVAEMGRWSESTPSIRRRLLILLLPPLLALMVAAGFANSRAAMAVVQAARDQRLGQTARTLASQSVRQRGGLPVSPSAAGADWPGGQFGPF